MRAYLHFYPNAFEARKAAEEFSYKAPPEAVYLATTVQVKTPSGLHSFRPVPRTPEALVLYAGMRPQGIEYHDCEPLPEIRRWLDSRIRSE